MGAPFKQPEWSALALMLAPETVSQAHRRFVEAGAEVITTNSYALVPFHIGDAKFKAEGRKLADLAGRLARKATDGAPAHGAGRRLAAAAVRLLPPGPVRRGQGAGDHPPADRRACRRMSTSGWPRRRVRWPRRALPGRCWPTTSGRSGSPSPWMTTTRTWRGPSCAPASASPPRSPPCWSSASTPCCSIAASRRSWRARSTPPARCATRTAARPGSASTPTPSRRSARKPPTRCLSDIRADLDARPLRPVRQGLAAARRRHRRRLLRHRPGAHRCAQGAARLAPKEGAHRGDAPSRSGDGQITGMPSHIQQVCRVRRDFCDRASGRA